MIIVDKESINLFFKNRFIENFTVRIEKQSFDKFPGQLKFNQRDFENFSAFEFSIKRKKRKKRVTIITIKGTDQPCTHVAEYNRNLKTLQYDKL